MALLLSLLLLAQDDPAKLIEGLRSDSLTEREAAALKLGRAGRGILPLLETASKDADPEVAARAAKIIGVIRFREALSPAIRAKHPGIEEKVIDHPEIATGIFIELPDLTPDRDNPVDEEITDPFPLSDLRLLAGLAVRGAKVGELPAVLYGIRERNLVEAAPELLPYLTHEDTQIRGMAAANLGRLRHRPAIPGLFKLLEDNLGNNRELAADALIALEAREIVPGLRRHLQHGNPDVRSRAAVMLGEFGAREAIPDLLSVCKESKDVEWGALEALAKMEVAEAAPFLLIPARNGSDGERWTALYHLVQIRSREALPFILPHLKDEDVWSVSWALESLGEVGDPAAIPDVQPFLKHENSALSGGALFALAAMGSKEVVPEVLRSLKDGDSNRRWFAVRALGGMKSTEHAGLLIPLLEDHDVPLRWAAMDTLGRIANVEALPALLKKSRSPLKGDREHASKAIQAIQAPRR